MHGRGDMVGLQGWYVHACNAACIYGEVRPRLTSWVNIVVVLCCHSGLGYLDFSTSTIWHEA